jgi:VWFA-related protein
MFGAALLVPAFAKQKTSAPVAVQDGSHTFRIRVDMVSIPVVVSTRDGGRVAGLQKEDFTVLEDGVPQEIAGFAAAEEPVSILLMLDCSTSVRDELERIQNEAIRFVNILRAEDSVAIMSVARKVEILMQLSTDRKRSADSIKKMRAKDGTAIYEAIGIGLKEILKPVRERKAMVIFSDGVDTSSVKTSIDATLQSAMESDSPIYSIYFNMEAYYLGKARTDIAPMLAGQLRSPAISVNTGAPWPQFLDHQIGLNYLKELADNSGGLLFNALSMKDLGPSFEEIALELASMYSIGNYPTNSKMDSKFRKIQVKVNRPGLIARSKRGYAIPQSR